MSTYPYTKRRNDRNQSAERLVKIRKLLATRNLLLVTGWLFLEDGFIYFLKKSQVPPEGLGSQKTSGR